MMEKYYSFAGIDLAVAVPDSDMYDQDRQLRNFRTETVRDPHRFFLAKTDALDIPEGRQLACVPGSRIYEAEDGYVRYYGAVDDSLSGAYIRAEHHGKQHFITVHRSQAPERISPRILLNAMDAEHLVAESGGVILHASFVEWQGKAILFTAPSETGKTTQAKLWNTHRDARIINGDRAVVLRAQDGFYAAGLPFAGSSPYCENTILPLAAVVYLRQAPVTTIEKLRGVKAFCRIWEGCCVNTWHREDMQKVTALVQRLAGTDCMYELSCTPDESAVIALEQQLRKQD